MEKLINGWKVGDKVVYVGGALLEDMGYTQGKEYIIHKIEVLHKKHKFFIYNDMKRNDCWLVLESGCWYNISCETGKLFELVEEHNDNVILPFQWRNIKFRTPTKEISKAVQLEAFKNGCKWRSGFQNVMQYEEIEYIIIDSTGEITYRKDDKEDEFLNCEFQEIQVQVEYKFTPVEKLVKEVIEFEGQKYYKEDYLAAIESLKKLSLGEVK